MASTFLNISTDNTLGGNAPSDSILSSQKAVKTYADTKQDALVSGTNIKTINGNSLLGSGNISIESSSTPDVDATTISYNSDDELQAIGVVNQNTASGATNPLQFWEGTEQEWETGGETDTYYAWKGAGTSINEHSTYSTTYGAVFSGAYGDGKFVMVSKTLSSSSYGFSYYSTDGGNTWTYNKPINMFANARRVYYVNGRFIAKSRNTPLYHSLDGINWTPVTSGPAEGYAFCWTGSRYISAAAGGTGAVKYCTVDTLNSWTSWSSVGTATQALAYGEYGNNKYIVAACEGAIKYITADDFYDGNNWTSLYQGRNFYDVVYHDGKFVAVGLNCSAVVDITGSTPTLTLKGTITASTLVYVNGVYYAIGNFDPYPSAPTTSNTLYYIKEEDLLTATDWSTYTLPETLTYSAVVTDGQKLILNDNGNAYFVKVDLAGEVFTLEAEPTTASTVYSAPKVESALTITSVGTGTITLSDTHTYDYTSADNQEVTNTVGESYPNLLCNIEEVGIKKGNTFIADHPSNFVGTDGVNAGTSGLVPAPTAADMNKYLKSDGNWSSFPVDQTYDSTSTNAVSGVALNNSTFLRNKGGSNGLAILGTCNFFYGTVLGYSASGKEGGVAVGYQASAGTQATAVGYKSNASEGIAIGAFAKTTKTRAYQLGNGTNSTADTLSIGFSTNGNYTLLDGTTGLIPVDRLTVFTGADGTNAGTKGAVPAPAATDNNKYLKGDGTWSAVELDNYVPTSRKVNNKALSSDITLTASDVGAISTSDTAQTSTITLATVATTGDYSDLSNKPTIPTVNNATLTIQKNGTTVNTFTANASSNVTANISVPTKVSDLTNDSGFITSSALSGYQTTANLVTSVSSSSTDTQYPSAKLFYDTIGDVETLINAL